MQGLFVREPNPVGQQLGFRRPKSKKEVRELVAAGHLDCVKVEATSLHGNEFGGSLTLATPKDRINFCGPDPYVRRSFYGTITVRPDGKVVVK